MGRRRLVWKLFPVYFAITLVSVVVLGAFALESLRAFYYSQTEQDLVSRARMARQVIASKLSDATDLESTIRALGRSSDTRITIIDPRGVVIADSEHDPTTMENHADRPEFRDALTGREGTARRFSPTLKITMLYVAIPIVRGGSVAYVIRASQPATAIDARPATTYAKVGLGALLVALLAGLASLIAARRISAPITTMTETASRLAAGDFKARAPLPDTEELADLADTMNRMASALDTQLRTMTRRESEQRAILASMNEGVVAMGDNDRILILNPSAEEMLGITAESAAGRTIGEVIRNAEMQRFIERSYASAEPVSEEMVFHGSVNTLVRATGTPLLDADGKRIGALIVLNDITQTRMLENMRKEFVANVSHELKTPITSIKGFVETLREGVVDDQEKAREFLDIVARQADRLNSIIEDLLALSAIEQKAGAQEIEMRLSAMKDVVEAAVTNCRTKASEGSVSVIAECPDDLFALINPPLLEQAITNLLDNAIKYSSAGGEVRVSARADGSEAVISVSDNGPGIEAEHIPRLFERFYRVDKARSRKLGGTGLGLAIVKHIVQAHKGRVEVESVYGKGSTFGIRLHIA